MFRHGVFPDFKLGCKSTKLVEREKTSGSSMSRELMLTSKQLGFCDRQIAQLVQSTEMAIRFGILISHSKAIVEKQDEVYLVRYFIPSAERVGFFYKRLFSTSTTLIYPSENI